MSKNPKTVGNYLQILEEKGFLKSVKVGKEKLYLNQLLLKILEEDGYLDKPFISESD